MKFVFLTMMLFSPLVFGNDVSFNEAEKTAKVIPLDKLKYQYGIQGEILVFEKDGKRLLYRAEDERTWNFGSEDIQSNWDFRGKEFPEVALVHKWSVDQQGVLKANIKQYDSMERGKEHDVVVGKLLREQEFVIEDLSSISWVAFQDDKRRVVVRFNIAVWSDDNARDIGKLGINSNRMTIYDSKGNLWASRVNNEDGDNVYFGVTTHMGSVYMSYLPFKGSKLIGFAEKDRIKIEDGKVKLNIESRDDFLPGGVVANVYGFVDLNERTEKYNSVKSNGSSEEKNFLKAIQKRN